MLYQTYVAKTIAGYGAHIANSEGPICSYGTYYNTPEFAEKDAIDWAACEKNTEYIPFNWEKYFKEIEEGSTVV